MIQPFESYGSTPGDSPAAAAPQAIVELQRSYYQGEIPREAALAAAALLSGLTAEQSQKTLPPRPAGHPDAGGADAPFGHCPLPRDLVRVMARPHGCSSGFRIRYRVG
jgi:hypothetical protein